MHKTSPTFIALLLIALLSGGLTTPTHSSSRLPEPATLPDGRIVVRIHVNSREHLNAIAGYLDIWEAHPQEKFVVAALTPAESDWLESLGYSLEMDAEKTAGLNASLAALDPRYYYFDEDFNNSNGRYIEDFLHTVNDAFPNLTELFDIGDAWQAAHGGHPRDLWVLRITNEDPLYGSIESKPVFFLFANMHAREVATPELALRYIQYLTSGYNGEGGYGSDADVTWLVNHNLAYVLLMQNPDGHRVNEANTGAYRRKNLDSDDGCTLPNPNLWGVDLNRNHSFLWGCCGGSSSFACDETYRGPEAASEPETQAFQAFFASVVADRNGPNGDNEIPPAAPDDTSGIFISLHSYSDLVLWPWDLPGYPDAPNAAQLSAIGRKLAYFNGYDPSGTIWYTVDGATDDWTYGKFGVASYTFEVGGDSGYCSGFFPAYGCINGIDGQPRNFWAENKPAFLYAHKIARAPYLTVFGPDAAAVSASPESVTTGETLQLTATIADQRYAGDPLRPISAAEYFVDTPGADGSGLPMSPADGSWGGSSEVVTATVDTAGFANGVHIILVHARNDQGQWGPLSAVFVNTFMPLNGIELTLLTPGELFAGREVAFEVDLLPDDAVKPYTYTLDFGDASQPMTTTGSADPFEISHTFNLTGSFTLQIEAWNSFNTSPVTDTLNIVISSPSHSAYLPLISAFSGQTQP